MITRGMFWTACGCALMLSTVVGKASAEGREFGQAVTVTGASDYIFRGISFTNEDPTVNVYAELNYGIAYVAFWTSNIDYGVLGPWEQDIYLGIRPETGPIKWDLAAYYYIYGNRDDGALGSSTDVDYVEFKIGAATTPISNLTLGATVWIQPDQGYAVTENISVEGSLAYEMPKVGVFTPTLSGLVGHSESGTNRFYPRGMWLDEDSYTYWNAGMRLDVQKFFVDFRYWGTTIDHDLADDRFVLSAGVNLFP